MCGISGFAAPQMKQNASRLKTAIETMNGQLLHRGPDSAGCFIDPETGIALGHRRLAIVDLSETGNQPMASHCGRYTLVTNSEIYNHQAVRAALEQDGYTHPFAGSSDTEVMLAAFSHWGLEKALASFNGMFAFALWDHQEHTLSIARDRIGEKPLYYGLKNGSFLFSSELKALKTHPDWEAGINRAALARYVGLGYIPAPDTIYEGIHKLVPGCWLTLSLAALEQGHPSLQPVAYWSVAEAARNGLADPFEGSDRALLEETRTRLQDSVSLRLMADVPVGAFLSGGTDSTLVAALAQNVSSKPVRTFTIGFDAANFNEAEHAGRVARHLGTDHAEMYVQPEDLLNVIERLPYLFDEPFSDSSQIPTLLVSEMTRQHVTVALSGDAGDELFGGYNRYNLARDLWAKSSKIPGPLRSALAWTLTHTNLNLLDLVGGWANRASGKYGRAGRGGQKLQKLGEALGQASQADLYTYLISQEQAPGAIVKGDGLDSVALFSAVDWPDHDTALDSMMLFDQLTYLPDDILVKVDRATMGVSLESRVPLLDHELVEWAWRVPMAAKIRNGENKWLLKQLVYEFVPREIMDRPKMGFAVPIADWLRGPLRAWAEELLAEDRLVNEGYFHPGPIRNRWQEHQSGKRDWSAFLWSILIFQAWLQEQ